jgi:hypothetical protein
MTLLLGPTSLADRAEQRADRFDGYRERRAEEADQARAAVSAIADSIPLGHMRSARLCDEDAPHVG